MRHLMLTPVEHETTCEGLKYLLILSLAEVTEQFEVTGRVPQEKVDRLVTMLHFQAQLLNASQG